ncbi:MAG TPA: class I SAM-dependent methyltransferase [Thermoanaerobaculia bacterium]|jgi:SAM-dependent methyltransferase
MEVRDYYHEILPFYDLELADRGDGDLWAWAASAPPGCRVLELGSGTGRATAALARTAAQVVALELAPEMIAVAHRKLAGVSNVRLVAADMRDSPLRSAFDLVAAIDDPFVHLTADEDRERAFSTAARHLVPGGRFLLDAAWLAPDQRHAADHPEGLVKENSGAGGLSVRETWRCDPAARRCTASYEYFVQGRRVREASFPARLWSRQELEQRARAAGLQIAYLWGDYDRRPWDRTTSPRLIAELRRG